MRSVFLAGWLLPLLLVGQGLQPVLLFDLPPALQESSGLLVVDGQVWSHNDSGNPNSLYCIDPASGVVLREVALTNAPNVDWEETTTDGTWVYVGDFGNNLGSRTDLRIYRFPLDQLLDDGVTSVLADTIRFTYADQTDFTPANMATNWDCEAFITKDDSLFLFTKNWVDQRCHLYALPAVPGDHLALRRDTLESQGMITGAAYDAVNEVIALIGYTNVLMPFLWRLSAFNGNAFFDGLAVRTPLQLPLTQTEAIAWTAPDSMYITSETSPFGMARLWSLHLPSGTPVRELRSLNSLRLQPNPALDEVRIMGLTGPAQVSMTDEQGAVVWRGPVDADGSFSVKGAAPGSYTVEISTAGGHEVLRLIVAR